jgi:hypothetical protein
MGYHPYTGFPRIPTGVGRQAKKFPKGIDKLDLINYIIYRNSEVNK